MKLPYFTPYYVSSMRYKSNEYTIHMHIHRRVQKKGGGGGQDPQTRFGITRFSKGWLLKELTDLSNNLYSDITHLKSKQVPYIFLYNRYRNLISYLTHRYPTKSGRKKFNQPYSTVHLRMYKLSYNKNLLAK